MSGLEFNEAVKLLMLIPFGLVLGTGILFIFSAIRWARQRREANEHSVHLNFSPSFFVKASFRESLFGQPCRWLAIKGHNPAAVQAALHLHAPMPCSWEEGLIEARERKLFISPPVYGWILVVGSSLPDPTEDVDECFHFLTNLSRKLGQIQFFSTNRVLNHHAWALIDKGRVFRAYAWAGETLWNQGPPTAAERDLKLGLFDYASGAVGFEQKEMLASNAERVPLLASRWSVDPASIDERQFENGYGITGELSHSKRN
ncbi:MAG: hypothetical protein ABIR24_13055 [Verrucomicrobiota bacterium]